MKRDDFLFWLQLGEIASKVEHLSGVPLRPEFARELLEIFLAKGVMATTAIEGNTLSEEQVRQQIEGKLKLPPSQQYLQQEIENIIKVCNEGVNNHLDGAIESPKLCVELIRQYNREVLKGLNVEKNTVPGEFRHQLSDCR